MADTAPGNRGCVRQKIPRIAAKEAARIYTQCVRLEESAGDPLASLRTTGFGTFLNQLDMQLLQLAVQPDSGGSAPEPD
jgi:hypothetical protein